MINIIIGFAIISSIVIILILSKKSNIKDCNLQLQEWANKQGYSIINYKHGIWNHMGRGCEFYIKIKTENNEIKTGRVKFGGLFIGIQLDPDKVELMWDK